MKMMIRVRAVAHTTYKREWVPTKDELGIVATAAGSNDPMTIDDLHIRCPDDAQDEEIDPFDVDIDYATARGKDGKPKWKRADEKMFNRWRKAAGFDLD